MAAALYRFIRIRDELRRLMADDNPENQQWSDAELDSIIGECIVYSNGPYSFNRQTPSFYRCPALGGEGPSALWLLMETEDSSTAPFSGTTDCVYEISCRGTIRVREGTESASSISLNGTMIEWNRIYDKLLEIREGRKVHEAQISSGDGSYTPTEEGRIRMFREFRKGAR